MDTKYKKILQKYIRKIMPNKKPGLHIPHDTGHSSFICGHILHLFVSAILQVEISVSWHLQISHVWMHVVFADGNCKQSDFSNPLHNSWSRSSQTADKLIYIYQQRQQNISQYYTEFFFFYRCSDLYLGNIWSRFRTRQGRESFWGHFRICQKYHEHKHS